MPVTHGVAGSSPVHTAKLICLCLCRTGVFVYEGKDQLKIHIKIFIILMNYAKRVNPLWSVFILLSMFSFFFWESDAKLHTFSKKTSLCTIFFALKLKSLSLYYGIRWLKLPKFCGISEINFPSFAEFSIRKSLSNKILWAVPSYSSFLFFLTIKRNYEFWKSEKKTIFAVE